MGNGMVGLRIKVDADQTSVTWDRESQPFAAWHRLDQAGIESLQQVQREGGADKFYGRELFKRTFQERALEGFQAAMEDILSDPEVPRFRLQLHLDGNVPSLHELSWESLLDPSVSSVSFACTSKGGFYRRLASNKPARRVQDASTMKVLAAISDFVPEDYAADVRPVDAAGHREALKRTLDPGQAAFVPPPVSFGHILRRLKDCGAQEYSVLHIVAPGGVDEEGPFILLENESRSGAHKCRPDDFDYLVDEEAPRLGLVVLMADHSASSAPGDPTRGFGPQLLRRGPAVVAIQGAIAASPAIEFIEHFYHELRRVDGPPVDQAMNFARREISARAGAGSDQEWLTPLLVLFSQGDEALERFSGFSLARVGSQETRPGEGGAVFMHPGRASEVQPSAWTGDPYSPHAFIRAQSSDRRTSAKSRSDSMVAYALKILVRAR
jgi:hypothetical protein